MLLQPKTVLVRSRLADLLSEQVDKRTMSASTPVVSIGTPNDRLCV